MLEALGFRRTHRHRSKEVELYRQGAISIVLNLEDEGFAHSFQLLHGLSVAALAVKVPDAQAAARRAADLLAKPFSGPIGAGELAIPAIRGDRRQPASTSSTSRAAPPSTRSTSSPDAAPASGPDLGLLAVDHVAQVVPQTEFLSWILYYRRHPRA